MARNRKPNLPEGDDWRTIVNMNEEGMPWNVKGRDGEEPSSAPPRSEMTEEETRRYTWAAVKAGLLVVLIFAVVFGMFIAFCDFVWFR